MNVGGTGTTPPPTRPGLGLPGDGASLASGPPTTLQPGRLSAPQTPAAPQADGLASAGVQQAGAEEQQQQQQQGTPVGCMDNAGPDFRGLMEDADGVGGGVGASSYFRGGPHSPPVRRTRVQPRAEDGGLLIEPPPQHGDVGGLQCGPQSGPPQRQPLQQGALHSNGPEPPQGAALFPHQHYRQGLGHHGYGLDPRSSDAWPPLHAGGDLLTFNRQGGFAAFDARHQLPRQQQQQQQQQQPWGAGGAPLPLDPGTSAASLGSFASSPRLSDVFDTSLTHAHGAPTLPSRAQHKQQQQQRLHTPPVIPASRVLAAVAVHEGLPVAAGAGGQGLNRPRGAARAAAGPAAAAAAAKVAGPGGRGGTGMV